MKGEELASIIMKGEEIASIIMKERNKHLM
jgi:hypothetical protein